MSLFVKKAMESKTSEELNQEVWVDGLSKEELELKPVNKVMTLKEFADKYEGTLLSILYRNNTQVGFVRLLNLDKQTTVPLRTDQEIQIDVEHPEDGLICFNLDQIRKNA
jgi:hypothetical protein